MQECRRFISKGKNRLDFDTRIAAMIQEVQCRSARRSPAKARVNMRGSPDGD
jgi:hypothetical protein